MSCMEFSLRVEKCCKKVRKVMKLDHVGSSTCAARWQEKEIKAIKYYSSKYNVNWQKVYMILHCRITTKLPKYLNGRIVK